MALFAVAAAGVVTIVAVVLLALVLVFYLVSIILQLRRISAGLAEVMRGVGEMVHKSAPVNGVVRTINEHLDTGVDVLEDLLVKKAGIEDAVGLVEGLYPGSASAGFRKFPGSRLVTPSLIGEEYTKGALTLARLERKAPAAPTRPAVPALREPAGTGGPIQYGPRPADSISWARAQPEAPPDEPEPEPAASEEEPAAEAPKVISWKRR